MKIKPSISAMSSLVRHEHNTKIYRENPIDNKLRKEAPDTKVHVYEYDLEVVNEYNFEGVADCARFKDASKNLWINIEGLQREQIKIISEQYGINELIQEDIFSLGHSTKFDSFDDYLYCLVYMLSYNSNRFFIEQEQVSIILGKNYVITFQEEPNKDAFSKIRTRLQNKNSKLRVNGSDFLFYELLDALVDDYFYLMDKLTLRIETVEDEILKNQNKRSFTKIIFYRKELMILRRNIYPLRDIITVLMRNEEDLFKEKTMTYLKDVSDHISQAREMVENYRESMSNMQDLYLNQENTKMNQSMKVTAIVTSLLAPATVIGGIFGMNFKYIPFLDSPKAFYIAFALMLLIPVYMIYLFKKKGWF